MLGVNGGTNCLLFRKDRVRFSQGGERLGRVKLNPDSSTRRMVTGCCNTGMFLEVSKGHRLTVYCGRVIGPVPPLQMRVMIAEGADHVALPNDVPAYPGRAGKFIWKLMMAWAAMGFRSPAVEGVPGSGQAAQIGGANA